jgi:hypothetical protein
MKAFLLCIFLLLAAASARSQSDSTRLPQRARTNTDSLLTVSGGTRLQPDRGKKSPWLAVIFSTVAPGGGQIYNTNYWKAPVIWGLGGYWMYEWIQLNRKYKDYQDRYNQSVISLPPLGNQNLASNRDFYHDERDKFAWYMGALYFINIVDAYVGAHLYDFDVTPDLGLDGRITPRMTATIRFSF